MSPERRELLWQEMDHCLELADRLARLEHSPDDAAGRADTASAV
jgi:hypothetical protein